jgi:hypothetical protein
VNSFTVFNKATKKYMTKGHPNNNSPELTVDKPPYGWLIASNTNVYYNITNESENTLFVERDDSTESGLIFKHWNSGLAEVKWNFIKV